MSDKREWFIDDAIAAAEKIPNRRGSFGFCPKCHEQGVVEVSVSYCGPLNLMELGPDVIPPTDYGRILTYCRTCRTILRDTGGTPPRNME